MIFLALFISLFLSAISQSMAFASDWCPTDSYRVKSHHRSSYHRANGTFVSAAHVISHCRKKSKSYQFWNLKIKAGYPENWPYKNERAIEFSEFERERIIEALGEIPIQLWLQSIGGIYRFEKSKDAPNPASHREGDIALYNSAFSKSYSLGRVIAHELAHELWENSDRSFQSSYETATSWQRSVGPISKVITWTGRKDGYVEEDGRFRRDEDFANNMEYYLFAPESLMQKTPTAFEWIKTKFSDKFKLSEGEK